MKEYLKLHEVLPFQDGTFFDLETEGGIIGEHEVEKLDGWKRRWIKLYKTFSQYIPKSIQLIWDELVTYDSRRFNRTLAKGLQLKNVPISEIAAIVEKTFELAQHLQSRRELWEFGMRFYQDVLTAMRARGEVRLKENTNRVEPVITMGDVIERGMNELLRDNMARESGELAFMPQYSYKETVLRLRELERLLNARAAEPIFGLLQKNIRSVLPDELRDALEEYFCDWYGSSKADEKEGTLKPAYIYKDVRNPKGSISESLRLEKAFLEERVHGVRLEDYIFFLDEVSKAVRTASHNAIRLSINGRNILIKFGAGMHHYDQQDPFTNTIPAQERHDIGIYLEEYEGGKSQLIGTIPSTWEVLTKEYSFFEYGGDFAFGPSTILPLLRGDSEDDMASVFNEAARQIQRYGK